MTTPFSFFSRASWTPRTIEARSDSLRRRIVGELSHLPMNPMAAASAALLFGASVLPWIGVATFAIFGGLAFPVFGLQASLWDLAGPRAPIPLGPGVALASAASGVLLLVGGFATFWRGRIGALLGGGGLGLFLAAFWGSFGVRGTPSSATVIILGPGLEWAVAGLVAGVLSVRFESRAMNELSREFRTSAGLARVGLFLAACFLAIDAADHGLGGNPLAVLGTGLVEETLHAAFVAPIALLVGSFLLRPRAFTGRVGTALVGIPMLSLILDGIYHATTGGIAGFVGHTGPEMVAHTATYYGLALLAVARFMKTR